MSTNIKELKKDEITTMKNNGFSIHTITVMCPFANMERTLVKNKLCMYCKMNGVKYYKEEVYNQVYWNFDLRNEFCVNRVVIWDRYHDGIMVKSGLDITLNPRHFYHKEDHPFTFIANQEDLDSIPLYLNNIISEVDLSLEPYMFFVYRIDLCANIKLGSRDEVKAYMRLMKKGAYAYNGKRKMEYSETQRKKIPTKNSFTVTGKSFEFAVYDKYKQMCGSDVNYAQEELAYAETQIRIELRVKRSKQKSIEEKYNISFLQDIIDNIMKISEEELVKYIEKTYGVGTFVNYRYAKKVIEEHNFHNKTKAIMIEFMKKVSKESLQAAKQMYGLEYSKIMRNFKKLRISPITIQSKEIYSYILNPIHYIMIDKILF